METANSLNDEGNQCSSANCCKNQLDSCEDDGSLWGDSDVEQPSAVTDLDREWKNRREQFYNHGYREGTSAGQNDSAQEGFNDGFKDSVLDGHRWGIGSALAFLPDQLKEKLVESEERRKELKEKLVESEERRKELKSLHESVHLISTEGAVKMFYNDFQRRKSTIVNEQEKQRKFNLYELEGDQQHPDDSQSLRDYFDKMKSLVHQWPKISVHLDTHENLNKVP